MDKNDQVVLEARDITKRYGMAEVLSKMNFDLREGEIHTLLGANGAGKSTLLKVFDGMLVDYEGEIFIKGAPVRLREPADAQKNGIGMVHQELSVLPNISIAENIFLNRLPRTKAGLVKWDELKKNTKEILESIGLHLDPMMLTERLTVADMQMIEIARILSMDVPIILLDEPTSALSEAEIQRLLELMLKLRDAGKSIVFITHKLDEILKVSDRITIMRDGKLVGTITVEDRTKAAERQLVSMMIGTEKGDITEMFPPKGTEFGDKILEVEGFGKEGVFEDISFYVREKEVVVITGLKGAKRTEMIRCVFGADAHTSGSVRYKGQPMKTSIANSIANHMVLLTEDRKGEGLVTGMSVKHNISLSTIDDCAPAGLMNMAKINEKANRYVEKIGIKVPSIDTAVSSLSGGNQQKVVIAKWVAAAPELYMMDEPTRGIDVGAKREIYKMIREFANNGAAIVVISSEIPEAMGLADRMYVMSGGKMVGELTGDEIRDDIIMHMMFENVDTP